MKFASAAKHFNTPWASALLIALLYLGVLFLQLSVHEQDPSYFIDIGDRFTADRAAVPRSVRIVPDSAGYDGQFYYQIALNPFMPAAVNSGFRIDNGPYRNQRILYPLFAWLFSLGNPDYVPAMLLILNYLALCAIAWLGGRYAQLHSLHAVWGILFGLFPGFLFTLTHDLTEILAVLFLLAGVLALEQWPSKLYVSLFLILAVLTRETALIAVMALGIVLAWKREFARWPMVVVPLAIFVLWQAVLWWKWGEPPALTARLLLDFPGSGMLAFLGSLDTGNPVHRIWIIELVYLAIMVIAALAAFRDIQGYVTHKLMWLCYGSMLFALSTYVWIEDFAFLRTAAELYLFSLILILNAPLPGFLLPTAVSTIAIWALVFFARLNW